MSRFGGRLRGSTAVSSWLRGGGGRVKLIQRGTIAITAGNATNTATITAVDPNNSRLRYLGHHTTDNGAGGSGSGPTIVRVALTNGTTITATRSATDNAATVSYVVVEYWPGVIRTVQRGTVTATAATSGTTTITAVSSVGAAEVDFLGWSGSVAFTPDNFFGYVDLTNTTTVTLTRTGTNGNLTAGFQVIEWI